MRNNLYKIATAALALAITFTFTSCGKDKSKESGNAKLLESIVDDAGNVIEKYEYDDKNRLVKIDNTTIDYKSDDLIVIGDVQYVRNGNTITSKSDTLTINKDGYIVEKKGGKYNSYAYQYQDGNMTELEETWRFSYSKFDDKKSPFSNSNTPKWLIQLLYLKGYALDNKNNVNNVLRKDGPACWVDYTYEYNSEGFPTKQTSAVVIDGFEGSACEETKIVHFIYPGRTAEEIAAFDAARLVVKKEWLAEEEAQKAAVEAAKAAEEAEEKALAKYIKPEKDKASKEGRTFTDKRDGKTYMWVKIGTQTWMAENLNYNAEYGLCYDASEIKCRMYGVLYYGPDKKTVCPSGWHLPSLEEWKTLVDFAGGEKVAGKKLKAKSGWSGKGNGTNDYGFLALPGGYERGDNPEGFADYEEVGACGKWLARDSSGEASFVYINGEDAFWEIDKENTEASGSYSVRCIKDEDKTPAPETDQTTINNEAR